MTRSPGRPRNNGKLGALLVELGLIEEAELYAVLALQSSLYEAAAEDVILFLRARLGDILLGAAAVTEEQLLRALLQQELTGEALGEILVRQGAISVAVREGALGFQRTLSSPFRDRLRLGRMLLEASRRRPDHAGGGDPPPARRARQARRRAARDECDHAGSARRPSSSASAGCSPRWPRAWRWRPKRTACRASPEIGSEPISDLR